MQEHIDEIEKHILENGLKKSFTGSLKEIINEMTIFFSKMSIKERVILIIKCNESKEITMDDIGLINDTIQVGMSNNALIVMHIEENDFAKNSEFELSLHYLLEE